MWTSPQRQTIFIIIFPTFLEVNVSIRVKFVRNFALKCYNLLKFDHRDYVVLIVLKMSLKYLQIF
ncbi:hypothetical protein KFK09_016461 [Dendrobium nobile]|uniref:Uncharacterized protein n=1 Tax=Dendrobium nobile TaxID=94219 RepID=A0A8T3AY42_DENNO|nr:hypothetical protein KFK09_016461 [Dendrobium nobile]